MIRSRLAQDFVLSPNVNQRRDGASVNILLLHYTGMATAEMARQWLCAPRSKVSCHYLVDEEGRITQMVDESLRAWHAGASYWAGERDINSVSVGIEIHNPGHGPSYCAFPEGQMRCVAALCLEIMGRHGILPENVLAHSDVAPNRKVDPGELFDWAFLAREGIGRFVEPAPLTEGPLLRLGDKGDAVLDLQKNLHSLGYGVEATGEFDALTRCCIRAFQLHFRQEKVDGIADTSTTETLRRLAAHDS